MALRVSKSPEQDKEEEVIPLDPPLKKGENSSSPFLTYLYPHL